LATGLPVWFGSTGLVVTAGGGTVEPPNTQVAVLGVQTAAAPWTAVRIGVLSLTLLPLSTSTSA
jgi:hypothetical protein